MLVLNILKYLVSFFPVMYRACCPNCIKEPILLLKYMSKPKTALSSSVNVNQKRKQVILLIDVL